MAFSELPTLSQYLQALIETTRADAVKSEALAVDAVEENLFSFFRDPAGSHAKALWLRRALKLTRQAEDTEVEEQLRHAVAHAFAVLQSLLQKHSTQLASPMLSVRYVACAALFLHLQNRHSSEKTGAWQPFLL